MTTHTHPKSTRELNPSLFLPPSLCCLDRHQCQECVSVSLRCHCPRKQAREEVGGESNNNKHKSAIPPPLIEPPPSPSVSEKLRVPPPANKAIRDGKDADTAAFGRHSEQKRKAGRGLKWGWRGGEGERCLLWLSIKNVSPLCAVREDRQ